MKPTIIETKLGLFRADKVLSIFIDTPEDGLIRPTVTIHYMQDARDSVSFADRESAERFLHEMKQAMRRIRENALEEHEKIPKCKFYGANKIQQCWGAICSARSFSGDDYWLCEGHDSNGNFSPQVVLTDSIKEQPSTESVKQECEIYF